MCKNNSQVNAYSGGFCPLQNSNGLIEDLPEVGYYSYTQRQTAQKPQANP